jgi:hypothetical protein
MISGMIVNFHVAAAGTTALRHLGTAPLKLFPEHLTLMEPGLCRFAIHELVVQSFNLLACHVEAA